jgi:hypothetical protein
MELYIIKRDGKYEPFSLEKSKALLQERFFRWKILLRKM